MKRKTPPPPPREPTTWPRANPDALAAFDPRTKLCTMGCGPAVGDPRTWQERMFLCDECVAAPKPFTITDVSGKYLITLEWNGTYTVTPKGTP